MGGERERRAEQALGDRGNWTGLAAGKGRRGAAQPGRWAGALLPAGSRSALRGAGFQPNSLSPAAAPVSHEKERSSFSGRESESGGSGSGAEDCRGIRVSPPSPPDHPAASSAPGHGNPWRSCPAVRGVPTPPRARPGFRDPHSPAGSSPQRPGRGGARRDGDWTGGGACAGRAGRGAETALAQSSSPSSGGHADPYSFGRRIRGSVSDLPEATQPDLNAGRAKGTHP